MAVYITGIHFTYLIAGQDIVQQCDGWTSGWGGRRCLWIFGTTDSPRSVKLSYHLCPRVSTAGFSSVATTYYVFSIFCVCALVWGSIKLCEWLTVRCCRLSWSSCSYALQQSLITVDLLSTCSSIILNSVWLSLLFSGHSATNILSVSWQIPPTTRCPSTACPRSSTLNFPRQFCLLNDDLMLPVEFPESILTNRLL